MADREIVIKIPEEKYDRLMKQMSLDRNFSECKITELPEGHGNLFDENDFEKRVAIMTESMDLGYGEIMDIIDEIPTIIEADNAERRGE